MKEAFERPIAESNNGQKRNELEFHTLKFWFLYAYCIIIYIIVIIETRKKNMSLLKFVNRIENCVKMEGLHVSMERDTLHIHTVRDYNTLLCASPSLVLHHVSGSRSTCALVALHVNVVAHAHIHAS